MKKHVYNTYFSFVHQVTEHNLPEVNEAGEDRLPKIRGLVSDNAEFRVFGGEPRVCFSFRPKGDE